MTLAQTSKPTATRLAVLDFGLFEVGGTDVSGTGVNGARTIGIPGYFIAAGRARILVDTGFPRAYLGDAEAAGRRDGLDAFGRLVRMTEDHLPEAQLARLGVRPGEITHLVLTHGDIDHVGGLHDFPGATLVVGAAERAMPRPRYFGAARPLEWPDQETQLVTHDTELAPGVTLLPTPGHSPGHLSLLVRLPETGPVLLTADAISRPAELEEGFGGAWDEAEARSSALRLMKIAEREGAWIIHGHDPAQWPTIRKAPEMYT